MNFSYTDEQVTFADSVDRYCVRNFDLHSRATMLEKEQFFDRSRWEEIGHLGWIGAAIPLELGGSGGTVVETSIILTAMGRHLSQMPYIECGLVATQLIARFGLESQRDLLLPHLVAGRKVFALASNEGRFDKGAPRIDTLAVKHDAGEFSVTGRKENIVPGHNVDGFIVSAKTQESESPGLALFLIPRDASGITLEPITLLDGSVACNIVMNDVVVSAENVLGGLHQASHAIDFASDIEDLACCAEAIGIAESVLWRTRDHLRTRYQYGNPLATLQALQHRMADMYTELEFSRSKLFQCLGVLDHENAAYRHRVLIGAKYMIARATKNISREGIQLHGASGIANENIIGRYYKRLCVIFGMKGGASRLKREIHNF